MSRIEGNPGWSMVGIEKLRKNWVLFLSLGVVLVLLGAAALGASVAVTVASMVFFGIVMLIGGVVEMSRAFWNLKAGGFWPHILTGVLYFLGGLLLASRPGAGAMALTLLIGGVLVVSGIFRAIIAGSQRFGGWSWSMLSAAIGFVLGILMLASWPASALWVIGAFIGLDLIFYGVSLSMVSLAVRAAPRLAEPAEPEQRREAA